MKLTREVLPPRVQLTREDVEAARAVRRREQRFAFGALLVVSAAVARYFLQAITS